jgi:hypothetical protein
MYAIILDGSERDALLVRENETSESKQLAARGGKRDFISV